MDASGIMYRYVHLIAMLCYCRILIIIGPIIVLVDNCRMLTDLAQEIIKEDQIQVCIPFTINYLNLTIFSQMATAQVMLARSLSLI